MASLREILFKAEKLADHSHEPSPLARAAEQTVCSVERYMSQRRQLVETQIGTRGREALRLLPFLLHVNQPGLPGFVSEDGCPSGITGYAPANADIALASRLFRNANPRRSGVFSPAIDLVAVMGSAGTIGFTRGSDLDVWVCHNQTIGGGAGLRRYREKVAAVERWLNEHSGLEIHLFLQATDRILANDFGEADVEGCGSAMGALLKEEFYRTAVHIAGKLPFWWVVPPGFGPEQYQEHLTRLAGDPDFATDGFVDLGWVAQVPLGELFGAAVWQIVKGWKSPFKSALKMGLLERAVCAEGDSRPLCELVKQAVLDGEHPDPYRVLFDQVLAHYRRNGDTATEDLLARCFYLKTGAQLDPDHLDRRPAGDDHTAALTEYIHAWGWGSRRVRHLNEFRSWRFEWVSSLAQEVDRFFLRTYKRIQAALGETGEMQRITPRDLTILGRKLQTVYRRAPHKIETVHLITQGVAESALSLYQEQLPDGDCPWRMYRGHVTPLTVDEMEGDLLRIGPDLVELLVWASQNHLLGHQTRLTCKSLHRQVPAANLEALAQRILQFVEEVQRAETPLSDLLAAHRPTRMLVVPNPALDEETIQEIGTVYATTWGETFYKSWARPGAFRKFAEEVLFSFVQEGCSPDTIAVFAPSQKVGGLHGPVRQMQREIPGMVAFLAETTDRPALKHRHIGPDEAGFFVVERQGSEKGTFRTFPDGDALLRYLSGVGPHARVDTRVESHCRDLALLKTVFDNAVPGMINVYCLEESHAETLYVVDEVGNLAFFEHRPEAEPYALAKLLLFLEGILPDLAAQPENPLTAPILGEVIRIHSLVHDGTCRVQSATHEYLGRTQALGLAPVGLTIEKNGGNSRRPAGYRITWGSRVFRSEDGINPLEEVRSCIHDARRSGLRYDIFITRLFLDDRFQKEHCGSYSTTGHYLFYKKIIEQRLSRPT